MKFNFLLLILSLFSSIHSIKSQNIADFTSINPTSQTQEFIIPSSHTFQKIIEVGDPLTSGGNLPINSDFTGYVPIAGSSTNGYLSINSEAFPGGVSVLDIHLNSTTKLWETTYSQAIDFSSVFLTIANCSGTVTPWNTVISCEEFTSINNSNPDVNSDGYYDTGWNVEIDPATKTVIGKLWAMGNMKHENVTIHSNNRTVYQGADSNPGYLYKYVANTAQNLNDGLLYVYKGSKNGVGNWILLNNTTQTERNTTLAQSATVGATEFNGIEDVEIGPDGMVYFAVKGSPENRVYRFQDSDPTTGTTVANMETFVGGMNYDITHNNGTTSVSWGVGNDNLAFDNQGNLWVLHDGGNNYIWVVENGHTQSLPKVKLFGIVPIGAEPTGITFTPDNKYLFMSIMHPDSMNGANQLDAEGTILNFDKGTSLVIALNENLGQVLSTNSDEESFKTLIYPNPVKNTDGLTIKRTAIHSIEIYNNIGQKVFSNNYQNLSVVNLVLENLNPGIYSLSINTNETIKLIIE